MAGGETGRGEDGKAGPDDPTGTDLAKLSGILDAPDWLRKAGLTSWLLVGIALLLVALVWLASLVKVIVIPMVVAAIVAAIGAPTVSWLKLHRIPRGVGTTLVMLLILLVGAGCALLVVQGILAQADPISKALKDGLDSAVGQLKSLGIDTQEIDRARSGAESGAGDTLATLLNGLLTGVSGLSSAVFFLATTILATFFLLKDGPVIRAWTESRSGLPATVSRIVSRRTVESLRAYFLGVTIIAAFNAVVVVIGALIIGLPLIGTLAVATFVGGFIPFFGAWVAGIFSVLLAWGAGGVDAAIAMAVVQVLANSVLQNLVQPYAMGSVLGIHPLAVLIVTIAGGALFGPIGLIVAAPLVAALVGISADLDRAKEATAPGGTDPPDLGGPGIAPTGSIPRLDP